jgi:hypothetical protein
MVAGFTRGYAERWIRVRVEVQTIQEASMFEPTTGTTTDPERDVQVTPRRLNYIGAAAALVVIVALLMLVIWLVPTDDAGEPGSPVATTAPVAPPAP